MSGHVDRSRASRRTKARGLRQRRPRTAGFGEALHDLFPVPGGGVPENDPTVEIDPFESTCRTALCPPRIGQVLLRRVRDAACHQKEGGPARADDDRFQRRRSRPRWSSTGYSITWSARSSSGCGIVSPRAERKPQPPVEPLKLSGRSGACPGRSASGLRRASHGGCSLPSRVHRDGA